MQNNRKINIEISSEEESLLRTMQLLGDPTRYRMFKLLSVSSEMCVSEIANKLGITVSAVSQHFRQFELVGIVNRERSGQKICYMLDTNNQLVKRLFRLTNISTKGVSKYAS